MTNLDNQTYEFKDDIMSHLGFSEVEAARVCSAIAAEIYKLPSDVIEDFIQASVMPLKVRHEELKAFQAWTEIANSLNNPFIRRAQVITQNYICFVYLKDSCFEIFAKRAPRNTIIARCCAFLTSGDVRKFRNGFAHGNWSYLPEFSGLEARARQKPLDSSSSLERIVVTQKQLDFWQTLARAVAYTIYETLLEQIALDENTSNSKVH
jgi:hypothetical protein